MELPPGHVLERRAIANTTGAPLTLIVEPWAYEVPLPPGATLLVEIEGPAQYQHWYVEESGIAEGYVSVWAWDGADARVLRVDGSVVVDWTGLRVPNFSAMDEQRRQQGGDSEPAV